MKHTTIFLLLISSTTPYNILVFCPLFGHSHSTFFGRLADILTEAGHNVTMFTPTIVDEFRNFSYTKLTKDVVYLDPSPKLKAIGDLIAGNSRYWNQEFSLNVIPETSRFFQSLANEQHNVLSENLPLLDELKKKNFDLILFETIFTCAIPLMDYLEIKAFALAHTVAFEASNYYTSYSNPEERIYPLQRLPDASFVFTNSNPYLDFPRATIAKNIQIGGISVSMETRKLGEEWDRILNLRNKNFLIAFGSVILSKDMPFESKVSMARAMKQFPDVTFIWKYEDSDTDKFAEGIQNIHFSKWIPQRELLADARLSAFMTHGGLGSVNEVSCMGKPSIMCPIMGDQMRNTKMLVRHNGSIEISKYDLGNSDLVEEVMRKVLYDESYKIAAQRLSDHLRNQPVSPKDLFLKHTEFAARFGKLSSLDPYSRQMGVLEYFMIDLVLIVTVILVILCLFLYFLLKLVCKMSEKKMKVE
ncbi:hypothetical protein CRE_11245 [Caenorhabditis remanei]|uniref:glucuronosyltransferase n=1 Tax=Caenorhabditis remanei TaxID=31234 RepID=E3MQ59_CAERE|nr:hypothetical protein CRE_11245 [Caenorhabditis remanei]